MLSRVEALVMQLTRERRSGRSLQKQCGKMG